MDQLSPADIRSYDAQVLCETARASKSFPQRMFSAIKHPKERLVAYRIDGLRFARERGDVLVTSYLLAKDDMGQLMADASAEDRACVDEVGAWLQTAEVHEAIRGEGACLVADHPFNVERLPYLDAIVCGRSLSD